MFLSKMKIYNVFSGGLLGTGRLPSQVVGPCSGGDSRVSTIRSGGCFSLRMLSPLLSDLISGHSAGGHPGPHEVNLFMVFQCFYQYLYFCSLTTINR